MYHIASYKDSILQVHFDEHIRIVLLFKIIRNVYVLTDFFLLLINKIGRVAIVKY